MINIAIDGPGGAGKSTVARGLAKRMNMLHLDTGALYRAFALLALSLGLDTCDEHAMDKLIGKCEITAKLSGGSQQTFLNGEDVSRAIRAQEISTAASDVSVHRCVREYITDIQRDIAKGTDIILDGRDIGTNVLPDADVKFFLTASPEVRAKRRYDEMLAQGMKADYNEVLSMLIRRDHQDESRSINPLIRADDAILIDSSGMDAQQVVEHMLSHIDAVLSEGRE